MSVEASLTHYSADTASLQAERIYPTREELVGALVTQNMISKEYADSGALEAFQIDEQTGSDALRHVLIGDDNGGAHHLRSLMELDLPTRRVASAYIDPTADDAQRTRSKYRRGQSVRSNGTFRSNIVVIDEGKGEMEKVGGSAMFPNEWSSEKVIDSIRQVGSTLPDAYDADRSDKAIHNGEIDGVRIRVITNPKTGKIVTGFPKYSTK